VVIVGHVSLTVPAMHALDGVRTPPVSALHEVAAPGVR
jgi:hypothetical protein